MTPGMSPRRRLQALLLWLPAAAGAAGLFAAGAALASWLDVTAGEADGLQDALLIDLTEIAPVEAFSSLPEAPAPEPEAAPEPEPEPASEPEPEPAAKAAEPPEPAAPEATSPEPVSPEPAAQDAPPTAPAPPAPLPKPSAEAKPAPKPEPKPEAKAQTKPQPKPAPKPKAKPKAEAKPAATAAKPTPGSDTKLSSRPKGSPAAVAKWEKTVQGQLAKHIKRKRFPFPKASLTLAFKINGSGQVTSVTLTRSSGNAKLDAAVLAHARKKASVAAPPNGKGATLNVPMRF